MFDTKIYIERRNRLKKELESGILLFLGNDLSPMNYPENPYPFRQDSTFLYFWGIDLPGLAAIIDIDENQEILFGRGSTLHDMVWTGPQPSLNHLCLKSGLKDSAALGHLDSVLKSALVKNRRIHFLPQYRPENLIKVQALLGIAPAFVNNFVSNTFIKAVVDQRSIKSVEEVEQIESALDITYEIHQLAMEMSQPGISEQEVVGAMMGRVKASGASPAFPFIFSVDGQILHNPHHQNVMQDGDIIINDSGVETSMHYASDITRTFPVGGKFTQKQKEIYTVVLDAQLNAIETMKPEMEYRKVHNLACCQITAGLTALGLMRGNVDEAVAAGAHALFMPAGLGHMMGLDVHDMEDLGEDYVGYTNTIRRSSQFGISHLRLARPLEPGFVVTVEPGIYFIPELIDQWKTEGKFEDFIDYNKVEDYRDFGGIRIEDNILVHDAGKRVLGKPIAKTVAEVETLSSQIS
ncbi:MAG: aminopeptidase P family protein [Desulfobacterales bacterium]|jgi:Xaa-Pro aminopeptidase